MILAVGPEQATLSGPSEANAGQVITVKCRTSASKPPADIQWSVDGQTYQNTTYEPSEGSRGGWIRTSWLNVVVPSERKELLIYCYASNANSSKNIATNKTVHIHCKYLY